ncbi:spliceosome-associated protein CWC27 homolog [Artemia franciscana]|uniref:Spliceosome-associated protein CWC27 homolog n=1 Tax=Artemia franciscana TaxID=6661 RepID=A0AA88IXA9_ARTSF|nr:hypothetical protein QYM36_008478 [Artemia franciscana]
MSNIYIQEPPTEGKVVLSTSLGDFEIELWSKECPKACRNFVQHCLNGYYDGTIFHRVVKGFIAQGGDPTGTGENGESIYGAPFKDEFHSRLRFVRRGLVAMANAGRNDNASQFFFTLGATPELQNKHTIFGKIAGNTLYNLPKFDDLETGQDDRPVYAPKVIQTEVISNPFPDIVARKAIQKPEKIEHEITQARSGATKNFGLLSFGLEAEEDEMEAEVILKETSGKVKSKSSHDLAKDPKLSSIPAVHLENNEKELKEDVSNLSKIGTEEEEKSRIQKKLKRPKVESVKESAVPSDEDEELKQTNHIESLRKEFKELKKSLKSDKKNTSRTEQKKNKETESEDDNNDVLRSFHQTQEEYRAKKEKLPPAKAPNREELTLAYLAKFKKLIAGAREAEENGIEKANEQKEEVGELSDAESTEDPSDLSWLTHELKCEDTKPTLAKDANTKDDNWFDIYDPRNPINKRKREKASDKSKKNEDVAKRNRR